MTRRFPAPWTVHTGESAYWVEDAAGNRFGFCYFAETPVTGASGSHVLTRDEARRLASNIAKLPTLLAKSG